MINGRLEQFLDTGWYSESTLFYNDYIYWCEAQSSFSSDSITFFVDRWRAENENNVYFHSLLNSDNTLSWERVFEMEDTSLDRIKLAFLSAPLFEGKTFWDVENKLAWLEEGKPLHKRP
ncbi:MAG: hypothetical protein II642_02025 [Firmicutes bacterium]|nr:hypothetical protein [Bacillota bacterium]